jgi:mannose-6-phosphate isomerase-like protein (cupin superfamily)
VEEIWFVLAGHGQIWRQGRDDPLDLHPGRCVTLPTGTAFQFRAARSSALEILVGTFPEWPGPNEAESADGIWT